MKKFLTVALAGVLAASMLFTGCSKKEESKYTLVVNTIDKETGDLITNKNGKLKININGEETEKEIDRNSSLGITI